MNFAQNLKMLRKNHDKTQAEMAFKFNLTPKSISFWENGEREPNYETLCALADYFGVTTDQLLGREPLPSTDDRKEGESVTNQQLLEKVKSLDGISLPEWSKIKFTVDESFRRKVKELEGELKLSCNDDVQPTIHSLFG